MWAGDITFVYLFAVMGWASRRILAWRLSNSLSADFCIEALEEAIARFGVPEIFNTECRHRQRVRLVSARPDHNLIARVLDCYTRVPLQIFHQ